MAVIGFHFMKMLAEKRKPITGALKIGSNLSVTDLKEAKISGSAKQKGIEFRFTYKTVYGPEFGDIELNGALVYLGTDAKVKEIMDLWGKEKKLPDDVVEEVYNHILSKCNMQTLFISRDMGLPPHIPMPKVEKKEKQEKPVKKK